MRSGVAKHRVPEQEDIGEHERAPLRPALRPPVSKDST